MRNQDLFAYFIDELADMLSSEHQITKSLPDLIKLASDPELVKALSTHLKETENQIKRIQKIFSILNLPAKEKTCEAMQGLVEEAKELTKDAVKSSVLDAVIISAAQKVEHYEMASYGSLRSFAKHLELEDTICELLQDTLDEEGHADKILTEIADGTFFSSGLNTEAAHQKKR